SRSPGDRLPHHREPSPQTPARAPPATTSTQLACASCSPSESTRPTSPAWGRLGSASADPRLPPPSGGGLRPSQNFEPASAGFRNVPQRRLVPDSLNVLRK